MKNSTYPCKSQDGTHTLPQFNRLRFPYNFQDINGRGQLNHPLYVHYANKSHDENTSIMKNVSKIEQFFCKYHRHYWFTLYSIVYCKLCNFLRNSPVLKPLGRYEYKTLLATMPE